MFNWPKSGAHSTYKLGVGDWLKHNIRAWSSMVPLCSLISPSKKLQWCSVESRLGSQSWAMRTIQVPFWLGSGPVKWA